MKSSPLGEGTGVCLCVLLVFCFSFLLKLVVFFVEVNFYFTFSIDEKVTKNLALEKLPILIGLEAKIK